MIWPHSFYARLTGIFLLLLISFSLLMGWLSVRSALMFEQETEQQLNRTLAFEMADQFQPYLNESIDSEEISRIIEYMEGINRRIEIYLLGSNGMIKASFLHDDQELKLATVDTVPLQGWLDGADPPVLGPDPLQEGKCKPFSVAPISIMGEQGCYLYIILGSMRYDSMAAMLRDSYIIRAAISGGSLIVLATGLLGMLLFALLTRRLRRMIGTVQTFEQGDFDSRIKVASRDELGQLAGSFNQMADTIVANMEELRRVDKVRRELVANVSHDLRSPLAMIQGYLETLLIKEDQLDSDQRRSYTQISLDNARRLSRLVEQLFELSRLDAQQVAPALEAFSFAELAQDLVLQHQKQAADLGVTLRAETQGCSAMVEADIGLLERVLSNLLENALRHTPQGGRVTLECAEQEEQLLVSVRDTGCGIPQSELPRIFERFYRVEKSRSRNKEGGTGLGLAIASKILGLHGSELEVSSAVGEGSCFRFRLPLRTIGRH